MNSVQEVIEYLESRILELKKEAKEYHPNRTADNWDEGDIGYDYALDELTTLLEKIKAQKPM